MLSGGLCMPAYLVSFISFLHHFWGRLSNPAIQISADGKGSIFSLIFTLLNVANNT